MLKSQIILLVVALLLVLGLYQLPTVVVQNVDKNLANTQPTNTNPANAGMPNSHSSNLSTAQQEKIKEFKKEFSQSADQNNKIVYADSIAALYRKVGKFDSAAAYSSFAVQVQPTVANQLKAADAFYEAFNFYAAAQPDKSQEYGQQARNYYQEAIQEDPENWDAKAKLATTYMVTQNPMQGIQLLKEVLEEDEFNQIALFNYGMFSMQVGKYPVAIEKFEKLLSVDTQNSQAKIFLGQSYANIDQTEKAISIWEDVIKTEKDSLLRAAAQDYLNQLK